MQLNCDIKKRGKIIANAKHVPYELEDNILTFEWEDMKHCLDLENMEFTRENDDYSFFLNIKEQTSEIRLKKESYYLQVQVEYANLMKVKNMITLKYFIETDDEETEVCIELEGDQK